jgi:hypothetical protein
MELRSVAVRIGEDLERVNEQAAALTSQALGLEDGKASDER